MSQIAKIVVPTDFSELATQAVRYAGGLARGFDAEALLIHVTEEPFDYKGYGLSAETILAIQEDLRDVIDKGLNAAQEACSANKSRMIIREGSPSAEIIKLAKEEAADLIVIGTHGRGGVAKMLLGGTTERIIRLAPCPVITVPK